MKIVNLYRYKRADGGTTVSPIEPECDYEITHRLIADEGMELVKGDTRTVCIDTDNIEGWTEETMLEHEID